MPQSLITVRVPFTYPARFLPEMMALAERFPEVEIAMGGVEKVIVLCGNVPDAEEVYRWVHKNMPGY